MVHHTHNSQILPAIDFDTGTKTASIPIKTQMQTIYANARGAGLDIEVLIQKTQHANKIQAIKLLDELHEIASILYLCWQDASYAGEASRKLALARIFNSVTIAARALDRCHSLIDKSHLISLKNTLEQEFSAGNYQPSSTAEALNEAASQHSHEKSWAWIVLPTFARQPYGRILLFKLEVTGTPYHVFVTQPFFIAGKSTLYHTHGRNLAFSRPLGHTGDNIHINTMWLPGKENSIFPLVQDDIAEYHDEHVVLIPPKTIHAISRKRPAKINIPPLQDMIQNRASVPEVRFGELACMHIYRPYPPLIKELEDCPLVLKDARFFIENDMIVFDHLAEAIWAGGGGAWARRMIDFGTTGEHCGVCYEDDPRRENLDPQIVTQWLVQNPAPPIQVF